MERQSAKETKPGFLSILSGEWIDVPESDRVSMSKFELKLMLTFLRLHAHTFDYVLIMCISDSSYNSVIDYLQILNMIFDRDLYTNLSLILSTDIMYMCIYISIDI